MIQSVILFIFPSGFFFFFSVRLSLRKNPVVRDRLFTAVLVGAFAHGFYLVYPFLETDYSFSLVDLYCVDRSIICLLCHKKTQVLIFAFKLLRFGVKSWK